MTHGLKRLGLIVAGFLAGIATVAVAVGWFINRDVVREAIVAQIRDATGLELAMADRTTVAVFPSAAVTFQDVRLKGADANEPPLAIAEVTARLRLLPLLFRRYEIADLILTRPRFHITRLDGGASNWDGIAAALAQAVRSRRDRPAVVSEIRITDGQLRYTDAAQLTGETLTGIDLSLAWPSIARSFGATGQLRWRGQKVDASFALSDIDAALGGGRTGVKLRLSNPLFKVAFDGTGLSRPSLKLDGTLNADATSLREVLRWTGREPPGMAGFRRFALNARTAFRDGIAALTEVNLELDGNAAEGALNIVTGPRQALQGTLAADRLDLTPYADTLRLMTANTRDWSRHPLDLALLSALDLDLRLSAARVTLGTTKLGRMAVATNLSQGTLTFSVGEAQGFGGVLKGSLTAARADPAAEVRAQFVFSDVDLEPAAAELFGIRRMTGRGDINLALDATGTSVHGLTQTLAGTVSLKGRDGAFNGLNVEQLLRRLERRPLSGAGDFRSGRTPFDRLIVDLTLANGIATTQEARLEGSTVLLSLNGTAQVPAREFDLKGVAALIGTGNGAQSFELPFVVQGPWDDPMVLPDPESLIRRSPASAPLLESLRERRARDAVRSAIDRLSGGAPAAPTPPEAPPAETPPAAPAAAN
jgi:AsmA protein